MSQWYVVLWSWKLAGFGVRRSGEHYLTQQSWVWHPKCPQHFPRGVIHALGKMVMVWCPLMGLCHHPRKQCTMSRSGNIGVRSLDTALSYGPTRYHLPSLLLYEEQLILPRTFAIVLLLDLFNCHTSKSVPNHCHFHLKGNGSRQYYHGAHRIWRHCPRDY